MVEFFFFNERDLIMVRPGEVREIKVQFSGNTNKGEKVDNNKDTLTYTLEGLIQDNSIAGQFFKRGKSDHVHYNSEILGRGKRPQG